MADHAPSVVRSLEQERAAFAWQELQPPATREKEFVNLAQGAPALVMGNGLMQALAYWQDKSEHGKCLTGIVCEWLAQRIWAPQPANTFVAVMAKLHGSETSSADYMRATDEALELLRWVKQFAAARRGA